MAAYLNIGNGAIEGESTEQNHQKWINIQTLTNPLSRSIQDGAKDQERARGTTTLHDIVVQRPLDKSSVKLAEACAQGTVYSQAEIHMASQQSGTDEPFLKHILKNVVITSYSMTGTGDGSPPPMETITLNFTDIEWNYIVFENGQKKGNVAAKFSPGARK